MVVETFDYLPENQVTNRTHRVKRIFYPQSKSKFLFFPTPWLVLFLHFPLVPSHTFTLPSSKELTRLLPPDSSNNNSDVFAFVYPAPTTPPFEYDYIPFVPVPA